MQAETHPGAAPAAPLAPPSAPPARPAARAFRIVHISDLHFGQGFGFGLVDQLDFGLWEHVKALVKREAPDLLVVSGDLVNSPWPFMLALAWRELDTLAREAGTVALVVPGNHDVGLLGNVYRRRARRRFWTFFDAPLNDARVVELGGTAPSPPDPPRSAAGVNPTAPRMLVALGGIAPSPPDPPRCAAGVNPAAPRRLVARGGTAPSPDPPRSASGVNPAADRSLPTFTEFRAQNGWGRLRMRVRGYAALLRAGLRRTTAACPRVWKDPGGRAVAVLLDSTFRGSLASGFIDEREIYGIDAALESWRAPGELRSALALRLAVLHHHPLPLPYSIVAESLTSYEPFLVLRNAGTLLRELWKHDFDLVLHGHKHFHSFARVGYSAPREEGTRSLSVLAAGSASVRHNAAGRNSLNVIEVHANGRVVIKPDFCGGGMTSGGEPPVYVQPLADLKYRNFRRAREAQGLCARRVTRRVVVDAYGAGALELQVEGLRVHGRHSTSARCHVFAVHPGRIDPGAVELDSAQPGLVLSCQSTEPTSELVCRVTLGGRLEPDAEPASYALRFDTPNGFFANRWEAEEGAQESLGDSVRAHVGYPVEELVIDLTLPAWTGPTDASLAAGAQAGQPWVRCLMPCDYPALKLDDQREVVAQTQFELDGEMTAHEAGSLMSLGERRFILRVPYPMVGYTYELRWTLPHMPLRSALVVGQTSDLRGVLLDYRRERLAGREPTGADAIRALLGKLLEDLKRLFGSAVRDERLALGLTAYDAATHALVQVEGVRNWERPPDLAFAIPFGEGLAGAVFKQRRALLYVRPELQHSRGGRVYLHDDDDEQRARTHYEAMLAVPLVHPACPAGAAVDPREVVGTLSFGSDSPSSGLVALLDLGKGAREALEDLAPIGQAAFEDVLAVLVGEARLRAMLPSGEEP